SPIEIRCSRPGLLATSCRRQKPTCPGDLFQRRPVLSSACSVQSTRECQQARHLLMLLIQSMWKGQCTFHLQRSLRSRESFSTCLAPIKCYLIGNRKQLRLEISFPDDQMQRLFERRSSLEAKFGSELARLICRRIGILQDAKRLSAIPTCRPPECCADE